MTLLTCLYHHHRTMIIGVGRHQDLSWRTHYSLTACNDVIGVQLAMRSRRPNARHPPRMSRRMLEMPESPIKCVLVTLVGYERRTVPFIYDCSYFSAQKTVNIKAAKGQTRWGSGARAKQRRSENDAAVGRRRRNSEARLTPQRNEDEAATDRRRSCSGTWTTWQRSEDDPVAERRAAERKRMCPRREEGRVKILCS